MKKIIIFTLFTGLIGCEKDLNSELTNHQDLNFKDDTINRVDFHESFESLFQPNLEEFTEFSNVNNIDVSIAETSISLTFIENQYDTLSCFLTILETNTQTEWYSIHSPDSMLMYIVKVNQSAEGYSSEYYLPDGNHFVTIAHRVLLDGDIENELTYVNPTFKTLGSIGQWGTATKDCLVNFWYSDTGAILGAISFFGGPHVGGAMAAGSIIGCGLGTMAILWN